MDEKQLRDNALFEELDRKKKKRKRRILRSVVIALLFLALSLTATVVFLRRQVQKNFASGVEDAVSYEASLGSISTSVSGSGSLTDVDLQEISVPAGVEITEVVAEANSKVSEGDILAELDMASVIAAMADVQEKLTSLDSELISSASGYVESYISSGVQGRIKTIYAETGSDVARCMYENGALAVLSLDGYMAVDFECGDLSRGERLVVVRADGSELEATVESSVNGRVTALVSDENTRTEEAVSIRDADGKTLGTGELYIHSPLRITGITGTVSGVYATLDRMVYAGSTLFQLSNTEYSAAYEVTLRERNETEETLQQLIALYQDGALRAPISGTVSSVDYDEAAVAEDAETLIATLSPDKSMSVTIDVDESRIMSLQLGQSAQISIDSVGDEVFTGTLTEINRTATSSSGVTRYTAVVTLDKTEDMLAGMTASVVIRISGVDNAVIIPASALHQTSATAYVYTEFDEETGEFGGAREVVAGLSNSSYVEIISGLEAGETVWYTEEESPFGGFGGAFPSGMGEMPGGGMNMGEMPGGMERGERPQMPGGGDFGGGRPSGGGFGG